MTNRKYLITYHNENTNHAIWVSEQYCFETRNPDKYHVMCETNKLLRELRDSDIANGIRMMLEFDGKHIDDN